jgi:nucleoside-diphosphate kinase
MPPAARRVGGRRRSPDSVTEPVARHRRHADRNRRRFMERTLIILKPDAVQRALVGQIVTRFENKGLQLAGMKLMVISKATAETHYAPHKERPFYTGLVRFMTSGPVVVLALQGVGAITIARNLMGATFGSKAAPGTIRGDFGVSNAYNLVHGSDSPEAAEKELGLFFKPEELLDWKPTVQEWVYDSTSGKPE